MNPAPQTGQARRAALVAAPLFALLAGCGTPGAPQPPSLNLPDRVTDLSATRNGNQVALTWTMPRRNTDKLPLKGIVTVRVCRHEGSEGPSSAGMSGGANACAPAGELELAPGQTGSFAETLPFSLSSGPPRPLNYFVELTNRKARSAGLSNPAPVLAGEAPPPVSGLAAELRRDGVVLRWDPDHSTAAIRLQRTLLTPSSPESNPVMPHTSPLAATPGPDEQNLMVEASAGVALDKNIALGNTYQYRAQRVLRESAEGKTLDLNGELSPPIRVQALDVFPPAVPKGLVAVATAGDRTAGTLPSIDLSWQPNTEPDLAGYEVYRREDTTPWQRISGDQPVIGPAFHDAQVLPGHTYRYGVSAVDKDGHESSRSDEAQDTVPNQ
jgi:hypothetical protein